MNKLQKFDYKQVAVLREGRPDIPEFQPGDNLCVHVKIREGKRERIQKFEGICIARRNAGLHSSFTVRKIFNGFPIERVFPLHSPVIELIERTRQGVVRRAKLYYLRNLSGKKARVREKVRHRPA